MFNLYKISNIIKSHDNMLLSVWDFVQLNSGLKKSLCTNEGLKEYISDQVKCYLNISYGGYGVTVVM